MEDICELNADGCKGKTKLFVLTNTSAFSWNVVGFNGAVYKV
jgi:hypothetical protein